MKTQPEEFDETLRRSAETERYVPFDEDAWQGLAGRLSAVQPLLAEQNQRRRRWAIALPWGLLLPMFGWNLWLQAGISDLKTTASQQTAMLQNSLAARQRDTLRETRYETIVQRDTIWLSAGTGFSASPRAGVWSQNDAPGGRVGSLFSPAGIGGEPREVLAENTGAETVAAAQNLDNQREWLVAECVPSLPIGLLEYSRRLFFFPPAHDFFPETVHKPRPRPRPRLTTTVGAGSSVVMGNLDRGWQGLETDFQVGFGRRNGWSAVLGLQRRWGWFLPNDGSLHGILPYKAPTNAADQLHHANANFRWLALAPGIQRTWRVGARADLFAAVGIEADFARKVDYDYEFESSLDPNGAIYHVPFSGEAKGLESSRFWLQAGLRRDMKRGYFLQAVLNGRGVFQPSAFFPEQHFLPWAQVGIGRIW